MSEPPVLRLNPALDPAVFARAYAREGVVRIPEAFEPAVVDRLAGILEQTIDWDIICSNERGGAEVITRARRAELGDPVVAGKLQAATVRARAGFAYVYLGYPMIDAYVEGRDPGHPIHALTQFLNSPEFIAFGAAVTGESGITKIDGQATCYRPGDFLTQHDDTGVGERLAAYTLGLTRQWRPDWGGQLLFHDDNGDVARGFAPAFNVLTLFKVPRQHSVAPVAPYAGALRLTVTGWLRNDPPNGAGAPIGG
ncbi:2OG-Fe(II) oxygenase family protein [Caulobacter sp. 602-1]|uniref:2OG-Fe(II) oxygenase family protein n=1 Tax=Caulobacter sp. 602-1 TaxID=2492472 RepID=UPI000F632E0B|nr:2OG-Fe(II) oxygenase family protein [Caulobacter sp. 602-1]RRN65371.1 proline hydroxylase [Caulobacter sp. 602-1]